MWRDFIWGKRLTLAECGRNEQFQNDDDVPIMYIVKEFYIVTASKIKLHLPVATSLGCLSADETLVIVETNRELTQDILTMRNQPMDGQR